MEGILAVNNIPSKFLNSRHNLPWSMTMDEQKFKKTRKKGRHFKKAKKSGMDEDRARYLDNLNSDNFRNLFTTMISPHLEYAAAVWSPHMKKDIQLIENVQRRATKQLPKISKLPYSERLRQLDLPTLRYRRIRGDMIEVFKILKYYDSDPNQILQRHTSSATRGHSLKLAKKQSNSNLRL